MTHQSYLPLVLNKSASTPTCREGEDLLQNRGFEDGPVEDPAPWIEATTAFDLSPSLYHLVQTNRVFADQRSAAFGGWNSRIVDEELTQSFFLPPGTTSILWEQVVQVIPETSPDPGDYFILTVNDAQTGLNLLEDGGIHLDGASDLTAGWYSLTITISNANVIAGQRVTASYNGLSDADGLVTNLIVDEARFVTHCSQAQSLENDEALLPWRLEVTPLLEHK